MFLKGAKMTAVLNEILIFSFKKKDISLGYR